MLLLALFAPAAARAVTPPLGLDGETADTYDYHSAIRERVYIPQFGVDQDGNGVADVVAIEIIRPNNPGLAVPAIIDPSPYYTTICRGNETQCIADTNSDGVNDKWPMFLDNYFVPRGYAVIYAEADGTANSTGCPLHGGPGDVQAMTSVVDWLQGRVPGYSDAALTHVALASSWHNGKAAMIGKSYDGTLTEGVAATGVQGLTTIVPESAIDDWYGYSRMGGIRFNTHYPRTLSTTITDTADRAACANAYNSLDAADGDATGDRNAFWDARDYRVGLNAGHVTASVLDTHGLQDDNVRMDHLASWWAGLKAHDVPRKLWLMRAGHADPFDVRRAAWVDTLHKWFDHWLYGIDNDVMSQPRVDIEAADGTWDTADDWPLPTTADVPIHLRATGASAAGDLGFTAGSGLDSVAWTNASQSETSYMNTPTGAQTARRVFLSAPLRQPLRLSGTPVVDLKASLNTTQSNLGALIVDYAPAGAPMSQITTNGEGLSNTTTRTCWGDDDTALSGDFSACYLEVTQPTVSVTQWRVTKGILDSSNAASLTTATPVTPDTVTAFPITLIPQDYVVAAGHQLAVILVGNYTSFPSIAAGTGTVITMDAKGSTVELPVVGGLAAAQRSGAFDAVTPTLTVPSDQTATTAAGASDATVTWPAPVATDDQDPSPSVACTPASGSAFPVGASTVTCTATDASGNATTGTFTVTVTATPAPPAPPSSGGDGGQTIGGGPANTGTPPAAQTATVTPPIAPPKPPAALDTVPLKLTGLTATGRLRNISVMFQLSDRGTTVTVTAKRHRSRKVAGKVRDINLAPGRRQTIRLGGHRLKPGRYDLTITVSAPGRPTLRIHRTVTVRTTR